MKKKIGFWIYSLSAIVIILIVTNSCQKDDDTNKPNQNGTVTDIEGNVYKTVTIGTQVWMAENLRTTKYNDGSPISIVKEDAVWSKTSDPVFCWYNNNASNKNIYGALYNLYAVNSGRLAPKGWHVSTLEDWTKLGDYLGPMAGANLKEKGIAHWDSPNDGTNVTGFTALPGGRRTAGGKFDFMGTIGFWWAQSDEGHFYMIHHTSANLSGGQYITSFSEGLSVRCVKD